MKWVCRLKGRFINSKQSVFATPKRLQITATTKMADDDVTSIPAVILSVIRICSKLSYVKVFSESKTKWLGLQIAWTFVFRQLDQGTLPDKTMRRFGWRVQTLQILNSTLLGDVVIDWMEFDHHSLIAILYERHIDHWQFIKFIFITSAHNPSHSTKNTSPLNLYNFS